MVLSLMPMLGITASATVTTRRRPLDFTQINILTTTDGACITPDSDGVYACDAEGWTWYSQQAGAGDGTTAANHPANTLVLDGATIDCSGVENNPYAIITPANTTIKLVGTNVVKAGSDNSEGCSSIALFPSGDLSILGGGSLEATSKDLESGMSYGVQTIYDLIIGSANDSPIVTFKGGTGANSFGVGYGRGLNVVGGNVTASGYNMAIYYDVDDVPINLTTTGTVKAGESAPDEEIAGMGEGNAQYSLEQKYVNVSFGPAASLGAVTISGTVGTAIAGGTTITVELANDKFHAIDDSTTVTWITGLPTGLTQTVAAVAENDTTATITISGTPEAAKGGTIAVTIPADALQVSTADLTAGVNNSAVYSIKPATPSAPTLGSRTDSGVTLATVSGCEYSCAEKNSGAWLAGTSFSGLNAATSYTFYQRVAAVGDTPASDASAAVAFYTCKAPPDTTIWSDDLVITSGSVSIMANKSNTNYAYCVTVENETPTENSAWVSPADTTQVFTVDGNLTPATHYQINYRVKGNGSVPASPPLLTTFWTPAAAPSLGINFEYETFSNVDDTMQYTLSEDGTADWMSSAVDFASPYNIPDGAFGKYIHIRVKASVDNGNNSGEEMSQLIDARPAAPTVTVNHTTEKTTQVIQDDVEYKLSTAEGWTTGSNAAVALEAYKTYYFRVAATSSAFASPLTTLPVPARPATPTSGNISATSANGTAAHTTKLTFTYASGSYEYAIAANETALASATWVTVPNTNVPTSDLTGHNTSDHVYVHVPATDSAYASLPYLVRTGLNISKDDYSSTEAADPTVSSKTDSTVVLNAQTVTNETVEYAMAAASAAPGSGWQDSPTFEELDAGVTYHFFARVKENETHYAGAAAGVSVTTKTVADMPGEDSIPTAAPVTASTITISVKQGLEYLINTVSDSPSSWEGSVKPAVDGTYPFSALTAGTRYYIHYRTAETNDAMPSASDHIDFYTLAATPALTTDIVVTQPTATTGDASKGTIAIAADRTAENYEYRLKNADGSVSEVWTGFTSAGISAITAPATYQFRVKGIELVPASDVLEITISPYVAPSSDGGSSGPATPAAPKAEVIVDGKTESIGKTETVRTGETTTTTVVVDTAKLETKVESATTGSAVEVSISTSAGVAAAEFVVKNVEDMAKKDMTLAIKLGSITYSIPTIAINTADIAKELGQTDTSIIPITVEIEKLDETDVHVSAGEQVIPPVRFDIRANFDGSSVTIDRFERFVPRDLEIPEVQAKRITTAIVKSEDGGERHVPTSVYTKDGKWFAKVNSRTNSVYAFIENEASFADAKGAWYENIVNEMASRKILNGTTATTFSGDASITRAEFAAILVRALGLPTDGTCSFNDVKAGDWYYGAVGTAVEYGIVGGYEDGSFGPTANITRQEAMAMVQRAAKVAEYAGTTGTLEGFADAASVASWAQEAAQFNVGSGLIKGADGALNPTDNITRAESATIILRLLQKAELVDVRTNA